MRRKTLIREKKMANKKERNGKNTKYAPRGEKQNISRPQAHPGLDIDIEKTYLKTF